jgi:hypothetical protein
MSLSDSIKFAVSKAKGEERDSQISSGFGFAMNAFYRQFVSLDNLRDHANRMSKQNGPNHFDEGVLEAIAVITRIQSMVGEH